MLAHWRIVLILLALSLAMAGCAPESPGAALGAPAAALLASATPPAILTVAAPTVAPSPTASASPSATATQPPPTATPSPRPTATPTALPPLIAIDPGHGGDDVGAVHLDARGRADVVESEVALDLALRLRDILLARGYRVLLTRDGDYSVHNTDADVNGDGHVNHLDEAQLRVDMVNGAEADVLLALHLNAYLGEDDQSVAGTLTLYCADRPFTERSERLAELVQEEVLAAFDDLGYASRDRGVQDDQTLDTPDSLGEHIVVLGPESERIARPCLAPGALSEPLFLTNDREARLAADPQVRARLALAYADALEAYLREYPTRWEAP